MKDPLGEFWQNLAETTSQLSSTRSPASEQRYFAALGVPEDSYFWMEVST
jgi:hypothetical protein